MSKMKLFQYRTIWDTDFLAIIKNGYVIDIACSDKDGASNFVFFSKKTKMKEDFFTVKKVFHIVDEIQVKDLALYTHWPVHTKEFWDLYFEACLSD